MPYLDIYQYLQILTGLVLVASICLTIYLAKYRDPICFLFLIVSVISALELALMIGVFDFDWSLIPLW